jgi:tetratricopeptide (TPR) repeat protein
MKSGLWILLVVIIVAIIVGSFLNKRLDRLEREAKPAELVRLEEIENLPDPEVKVSRLEEFIAQNPDSEFKSRAYRMIAGEMVNAIGDTLGFIEYAERTLADEVQPESRAVFYYWLYSIRSDTDLEATIALARRLLDEPIEESGIYNYVGYGLAERGEGLDVALELCEKALRFADSRMDSANILDSRGWVRYKQQDYDGAVSDLEEAVALFGEPHDEVLAHLAYAALRSGHEDKAFEILETLLVMGEYGYVRASLDSIMEARGYAPSDKAEFEERIWERRLAEAPVASSFTLPTIDGETYEFDPSGGVAIINFTSPT